MAVPKVRLEQAEQQDWRHATRQSDAAAQVTLADDSHVAIAESPARELQAHLSRSLGQATPAKWSARRTLLFIVGVCGAFWLTVGLAVAGLVR